MNEEELIKECKKNNIIISNTELEKLKKYKELLKIWNEKFNLTSIIDEKDIYLKHYLDCIYLLKYENFSEKEICDFGTGAGFPGIVIAIFNKNSNITLIESNSKKITFLNEVKKILKLDNVTIINDRVELYGKKHRELFDIVTCRAVSHLNIILELSISLLKINGYFMPMKSNVDTELIESKEKCKKIGFELVEKNEYLLPIEESKRTILKYKKIYKTDLKYPRNYNIIKNNK